MDIRGDGDILFILDKAFVLFSCKSPGKEPIIFREDIESHVIKVPETEKDSINVCSLEG